MQSPSQSHPIGINPKYDYIIAGAGCAGLSLLMHIIASGRLANKKILLVDKDEKRGNDRTWCFWEKEAGLFEPIVYQHWNQAWIHNENFSRLLSLEPFTYKLVRGIDFYDHCFKLIRQQPNIDILHGEIEGLVRNEHGTSIIVDGETIAGTYVFNSILFAKPILGKNEHYLLQHFKGYFIETADPVFNPAEATLMDFRVSQREGTTFVYVMPFTTTTALVEYTLFSKNLLEPEQYDQGLTNYIKDQLKISSYSVREEEFGIIPMTSHRFPPSDGNTVHIGTAGGQTKASSGYTFRFIQKHSAAIVRKLINGESPVVKRNTGRFHFYDSVLLDILANDQLPGSHIFSELFRKNKTENVLRFLDNESSMGEELKIIGSLPTWPFLKSALRQL
ncbi:MAG TPA: lycopene cyclase family protein [Chitinophagaceae bacterium]|nr:lycopene cyclase family protein [Chitinophagaceae bacterium]